ncbi:holin [Micrococcus luteus]|uniref:holin n=1 Tax=Micrococcus luteus TaxID=1270 RepID=UPI0034348DAA
MWTLEFWKNVVERAIKTAAQFAIGAGVGGAASIFDLNLLTVLGAAGVGALLSVLTSLGTEALPVGNPGTASLTKAVEAV